MDSFPRVAPPPSQVPPVGVIPIHPDFRMIVLANRPGFPFLGNDFFAALGDVFSCHAVDNPDLESEMVGFVRLSSIRDLRILAD